MSISYNKYYQTENLFGNPYPELIDFFAGLAKRGKLLDLGCGQGRDAIPLARLGFEVTGVDTSKVGIGQMIQIAEIDHLPVTGIVKDIYEFDHFADFDFVLLDSMFHFTKKDLEKETAFIKKVISKTKIGCLIVFCVQDTGHKVETLFRTMESTKQIDRLAENKFEYVFEDKKTGHQSRTDYRMIVVQKV